MNSFIKAPTKIPFYLKIGLWIARKKTGIDLLPARLLAWYPKAAISSGIMELMVADGRSDLSERLLKLVRIQTSFIVSCSFCIDMNSFDYDNYNISEEEISCLKNKSETFQVKTFSKKDSIAINYSRLMSETPLNFTNDFIIALKENFTEREIVILATTIAQVNYWARLIQGLGIPPAGFSENCKIIPKNQKLN